MGWYYGAGVFGLIGVHHSLSALHRRPLLIIIIIIMCITMSRTMCRTMWRKLLIACCNSTEVAQWGDRSCSRPKPATDNGLFLIQLSLRYPNPSQGSTLWAPRIARCKFFAINHKTGAATTGTWTRYLRYARPNAQPLWPLSLHIINVKKNCEITVNFIMRAQIYFFGSRFPKFTYSYIASFKPASIAV